MSEAIRLLRQAGVIDKTGGPFGAVVVRNGEVLSASATASPVRTCRGQRH
jgi:tRNA(Arg) A34 adenosine deaminase TadA